MHILANITKDHSQDLQSGVWEPGHSAFSPLWCLGAALLLLLGALFTQNLMALDRGLTPPKQTSCSQPSQSFEKHPPEPGLPQAEAVGWTCSSQRPDRNHHCPWPPRLLCLARRWHLLPQNWPVPIPTVAVSAAVYAAQQLAATPESEAVLPRHQTVRSPASCWTMPVIPRDDSWRERPHHFLLLWPPGHRQGSATSGEGRAVPGAADSPLTFPRAGESSAKPAQTFPFAKPTAAVPGARSLPCQHREAKGDTMRQQRLWQLLPFIRSAHGAGAGAAPRRAAAPRWAAARR